MLTSVSEGEERSKIGLWYVLPDGTQYFKESYKPRGKARYFRFVAKCIHHGSHCIRKKACHNWSASEQEPLAYLMAWQLTGQVLSEDEHRERSRHPTDSSVLQQLHFLQAQSSSSSSGAKSSKVS